MKNSIPLIVAAVVAALAVALVWRRGNSAQVQSRPMSEYCVFIKDMKQGDTIAATQLTVRKAPAEYAPKRALLRSNNTFLVGRQLVRDVPAGDYIVPADVEASNDGRLEPSDVANTLVAINFSSGTTGKLLRKGCSVVIMGVGTKQYVEAGQEVGAETVREDYVLAPILKRPVVVAQVLGNGASILVELPMTEAQTLLCAQRELELFPWVVRDNCHEAIIPKEVSWSELRARLDAAGK
jgi:hypothetical protein